MTAQIKHMLFWIANLAGWASLLLLIGWMTAQAAPQCGPYDAVVEALRAPEVSETGWAECTFTKDNIPCQWFKSARGTFTILAIPAPGVACLVFSGQDLTPMRPDFPDKPKEAGP